MNNESMIATIKAELHNADYDTLYSVLDTLSKSKKPRLPKRNKQSSHKSSTPGKALKGSKFIGENLTFEEIKKLTRKERGALQWSIKEKNRKWLEQKYDSIKALWVMVIDGEIYSWGEKKDYPQAEQIREIIKRTGKYPFIFTDDRRLLIEESDFIPQKVFVEIVADSGNAKSSVATIYCVENWRNSPFVSINPKRTSLVGRDLLFELS